MAKPTSPIVVWARQDVNLPGTGKPNKSKPIDDLLDKGYDKGQKPAAEEFNYILNQSSGWIDWIVNEKFPDLEAEIAAALAALEDRINLQLTAIREDISQLELEVSNLKTYVDQQVTSLRQEITTVKQSVVQLRSDMDTAIATLNNRIDGLEPRLMPFGAILPWPGQSAPAGWLECNGQVFNTSQNPKLFSVLGKNTVPDYRGLFLRGWAHGSSTYDPEPNRAVGSVQMDLLKGHEHQLRLIYQNDELSGGSQVASGNISNSAAGYELKYANKNDNRAYDLATTYSKALSNGAVETRPKNAAVMYIIKTDLATSSGSTAPTAILVSPDTITNRVGTSTTVTATVLPSSIAGQYPVTFLSQNPAVATVNSSGLVTLVGPGTTNIIASISTGMNSVISVTSYSLMTAVTLGTVDPIQVGTSFSLPVGRTPSTATEPLQFLTNNAGVATVSNDGAVSGVTPGTATITVRGTYSGVQATQSVTIIPEVLEQTIEDIQMGIEQQGVPSGGINSAPEGCAITAVPSGNQGVDYIRYKPIQKKVDGVWVTISG